MNENLIMEIPKAFKKGFCKKLIKKFENNPAQHTAGVIGDNNKGQKVVAPKVKDDTEIQFDPSYMMSDWKDDLTTITKQVAVNMKKYVEHYSFTDDASQLPCGLYGISDLALEDAFNMQRFDPGKGFFTYHCETGADSNSYRQIVWMVYLNDIKEKGGTLFKYQNLRVAPEAGKMVIWPAGWTHFHKSEIAPKETKYILTGWYIYKDIVGKEPPPSSQIPGGIQLG